MIKGLGTKAAWKLRLCVCCTVGHDRKPRETAEPIEMPFWSLGGGGQPGRLAYSSSNHATHWRHLSNVMDRSLRRLQCQPMLPSLYSNLSIFSQFSDSNSWLFNVRLSWMVCKMAYPLHLPSLARRYITRDWLQWPRVSLTRASRVSKIARSLTEIRWSV